MSEIPADDRPNETAKSCPRCGAGLSAPEAVQGLCAGCLLVAALDSRAEGESAPRKPSPSIESLAPHFPDLELLELVGQGGMGAVYRVRQKKLARFAALKLLALDGDATPAFAERFEREARTLASLGHENIVAIYDQGRAGPHWYLLMEYVDGVSLRQMIRAREVDPRTALGLVAQICDALQCAHDRGVVHRDVKPENVLVDRRGRVKILDFGLAKLLGQEPRTGTLTETGQIMGTPRYMAPEQWERPLSVDHRADIYAVGVVFYELLTGELPIGAFQLPSHFAKVDARVDPVVMKTLAKEPERRYQHASEVSTDVQRIASGPAAPAPIVAKTTRSRMPTCLAISAIGCLVILVLVFVVTFFLGPTRNAAAEERAREQQFEAQLRAQADDGASLGTSPGPRSRETKLDEFAGPPLGTLPVDAPPAQVQRARTKLDALWRVYLHLERDRVAVTEVQGTRVTIELEALHNTERQFLGAFAASLDAPTELVQEPDEHGRYRLATAVATVDRLSPAGPGKPRLTIADHFDMPSMDVARTQLAEFFGEWGAPGPMWFPALEGGAQLTVQLAPRVSVEIVAHSTSSSAGGGQGLRFEERDIDGAGLRRFVEQAREAWNEKQKR